MGGRIGGGQADWTPENRAKVVKVGIWACLPLRALPTADSWGQASAPVLARFVCVALLQLEASRTWCIYLWLLMQARCISSRPASMRVRWPSTL
jgi:hypothetical protein